MKKIAKAFGFVILIHVFAIYLSYIVFTVFNIDFYVLFNYDFGLAFVVHNLFVGLLYFGLRLFLGKWYQESHKWPFQSRMLLTLLFAAYAFTFLAYNQGYDMWSYFFWFYYPIGSFFRTVNASDFSLTMKLYIILSIMSNVFLLSVGDGLDRMIKRYKKNSLLTSLTKQNRT